VIADFDNQQDFPVMRQSGRDHTAMQRIEARTIFGYRPYGDSESGFALVG